MEELQGDVSVRPSAQGFNLYVRIGGKSYCRHFEAPSHALAFACTGDLLISANDGLQIVIDGKQQCWAIATTVPDGPSLEAMGFIRADPGQ